MSACRYEKGPCTYPTLRRHFRCQDGSCPEQAGRMCSRPAGPADETKPPISETPETIHETKPAAPPPAREEEKTMADKGRGLAVRTGRGVPMEVGQCPRCEEKGVRLKVSDTFFAGGKGCKLCYKRAQNAVKRAAAGKTQPVKATSPAKAAKAPGAPKEPRPAPIVQQEPAGAPSGRVFVPLTGRNLAEALQSEEVGLLVTCRTAAAVLAVVRAVASDSDVMVAV